MTLASGGFSVLRLVGPFIICSLALANTPAIAQAGATPPLASGEGPLSMPKAKSRQHPCQVLSVSFALRWSKRQQRMDYRSIFLSVSYGRKVVSTRWQSAPRVLRALRNSCREPPIGAGSVIHSM